HQVFADGLLETGVELVAAAGPNGRGYAAENVLVQSAHSGGAREEQVFVERRFKRAGVCDAQHGPRPLDVVSDADPRFGAVVGAKAGIAVGAETDIEQEMAPRDGILRIHRELIDVAGAV